MLCDESEAKQTVLTIMVTVEINDKQFMLHYHLYPFLCYDNDHSYWNCLSYYCITSVAKFYEIYSVVWQDMPC